jgi:pimeloyl-ACP methyl ester carboxylesterase
MRTRIAAGFLLTLSLFLVAVPARATPREARVPLRDGELRLGDLSKALCRELHLPACDLGLGTIDVKHLRSADSVAALNESLGDGCRVTVDDDALVLHIDTAKLPRNCAAMSKAVRVFTAIARPAATAAQAARYGLQMPAHFDPARRLVVLVHGLDCANRTDMEALLARDGFQVACFTYPSDEPIADSAALFARHVTDLRRAHPESRVDVIAHSMGGLVARAYVEGPDYAGGVDRLILVGTPNAGSHWSRIRMLLEWQEHYQLWRHEPAWNPSWMITDGLGEAGRDLRPDSAFLKSLNARPRREGVRYTVVAGTQSPVRRVTASCLASASRGIGGRAAGVWGVRQLKSGLGRAAQRLRDRATDGDGPVSVGSAKLPGVDDVVLVQADHATLYFGTGKTPPAAWDSVRDRLSRQ